MHHNLLFWLVILGILILTSFILALREALVAKTITSGIFSSIFLILELYASFLTTSFFTPSLSLLKSTGTGTNLSRSYLSALLFKSIELVGTFFNLSVSILSTSDFKLAKPVKDDVSLPVEFFESLVVAYLDKCNSSFTFAPKDFGFGKY